MKKSIALFLLVICLAACSMPETRMFSLRMPAEKNMHNTGADASVAMLVTSPRYLTQPYIAFRNSPYELLISHYSKWDSAPDEMVKEAFKESLLSSGLFKEVRTSNLVPAGFYALKIHLKHFERSDNGTNSFSDLVFDVTLVSPDGRDAYQRTVDKKTTLENKSFLALAKALSGALSEGMEEVRTDIAKSMGQH